MTQCFNWKVLAGLAAVGVGLYVVRPDLVLSALPLLLLAACPLSMLFMGRMMGGQQTQPGQVAMAAGGGQYTCPMHPEARSDRSGKCPKCGMELVQSAQPRQEAAAPAAAVDATLTREEQLARLRAELQTLSEQQAALARQVEELEPAAPPSRALEEAEQVARAAETRR